jgi:hypothetical protein
MGSRVMQCYGYSLFKVHLSSFLSFALPMRHQALSDYDAQPLGQPLQQQQSDNGVPWSVECGGVLAIGSVREDEGG